MKKLLLILPLFTGCAYLSSHTKTPVIITEIVTFKQGTSLVTCTNTHVAYATTDARAITFFDATNSLTKFRNSNGGPTNAYSAGTVASGLSETSSGSNFAASLQALSSLIGQIPK